MHNYIIVFYYFYYIVNYYEVYELQRIFFSICDEYLYYIIREKINLVNIKSFVHYLNLPEIFCESFLALYHQFGLEWEDFFIFVVVFCLYKNKKLIECIFIFYFL